MSRSSGRRCRNLKSEINIIPLLDVFLVLLLIFMVTTPIMTQSVEVDLPYSSNSKSVFSGNNPIVIIEVADIGQYNLVIDRNRITKLPLQQIMSEAQRQIKVNPKTVFLIGGTKDVPYNEIIQTLNLLHLAGVKDVGLMIQPI